MIEQLITIAGTAGALLAVVLPLQLRAVARLDRRYKMPVSNMSLTRH